MPRLRRAALASLAVLCAAVLAACGSVPLQQPQASKPVVSSTTPAPTRDAVAPAPLVTPPLPLSSSTPSKPGAYYKDDGPGQDIPEGLLSTPDAEPKIEPLAKGPSKPYTVFDRTYVPITDGRAHVERGVGSWYGKKFHGKKTASGEVYDMFRMTAAHPTLPIPSYARVTNLRNGKQVIVRINDRGPFHSARIIDLSYTAALKLDYIRGGSVELEVERLLPDEIARLQANRRTTPSGADPLQALLKEQPTPSQASVPSESSAPIPPSASDTGFFLQFGAYAQEQNALAMRDRLLSGWPAKLPAPKVVQSKGLYRLHSGPFESRETAAEAARQLKVASQIQTTLVQN